MGGHLVPLGAMRPWPPVHRGGRGLLPPGRPLVRGVQAHGRGSAGAGPYHGRAGALRGRGGGQGAHGGPALAGSPPPASPNLVYMALEGGEGVGVYRFPEELEKALSRNPAPRRG